MSEVSAVYDLLLSDYIKIDNVIFTSGKGKDYHIYSKSSEIDISEANSIERNALPKGVIGPDVNFKRALKIFPLPTGRIGISYITYAGRDEFGRPARWRAHVLIMPKTIYEMVPYVASLKDFFLEEDADILRPIQIPRENLIEMIIKGKKYLLNILEKFLFKRFPFKFITAFLSGIFSRRKIIFVQPTYDIDTTDIFSNKSKISSYDFLASFLLLVPKKIKSQVSLTSFSVDALQENSNITFLHPSGYFPEKGFIRIDLEEKQTYDLNGKSRVIKDNIPKNYIELISSIMENKKEFIKLDKINSLIDTLIDIYMEEGVRKSSKILDTAIDLAHSFAEEH
ncbi:MAG: hypothetical protein Q6351_004420 [Candidatus Njordarchaeum guaymaensis]